MSAPSTVVLIHGFWMTPRSWEKWVDHYTRRGLRVLAPAAPGMEVEVEALREDPSPIAALTVPDVVDHYEGIIRGLDTPPIIMGHSFGGLVTQLLLDRGLGAAAVAIDSAPTEGVLRAPWSQLRSIWPIVRNPANRDKAVGFTPEEFHYVFTNTLSEEASRAAYDRYHVPASARLVWQGVLANVKPGHSVTYVDYKNADRAPLLFIAGGEDHIMPASVNRANAAKYLGSGALTDCKEFPDRSHFTVGQEGWEEVADYALDWALRHARGTQPAGAPAS